VNSEEYEIVQNSALGACALWHFTDRFNEATAGRRGPSLVETLPLLPLVFHRDSAQALGRRRYDGGLYTALGENRALFVGLQKRVEDMVSQTFRAINVGLRARLIYLDGETGQLYRVQRVRAPATSNDAVRLIFSTSQRLGHWFAQSTPAETLKRLQLHL
jgi:hypothetical protein